jgi:hypothetical protein
MKIARRVGLALVLALTAGLWGTCGAHAADPLKVGFVYVGPIGDHGYTYQHDQGRLAVEKHFGDKVKTTYVENVPENADAERVIRQLVASGHQLIFTTSFGFMNPTAKAARQFPNVKFEHATGYRRGPNLAIYTARFYEGRYAAGIAAGRLTKSHTLGYIASFPIPEVVRTTPLCPGAPQLKPKTVVRVVWLNTWFRSGKDGKRPRLDGAGLRRDGANHTFRRAGASGPRKRAVGDGQFLGHGSRFGPKSIDRDSQRWSGLLHRPAFSRRLERQVGLHDTWNRLKRAGALGPFNRRRRPPSRPRP